MSETEYTFGSVTFSYRLYKPMQETNSLPLIVHIPSFVNDSRVVDTLQKFEAKYPCYILIPEFRDWADLSNSQALQRLIFEIRIANNMDICRTYLIGDGLGAIGVWNMYSAYPRVFAGTIVVDGCGDPYRVRNAVYAPAWIFYSGKNAEFERKSASYIWNRKYLAGAKRLYDALKTAGSQLQKYSELALPDSKALESILANHSVIEWLFDQDRKKVTWVTMIKPGVYRFDDWFMSSCYLIVGKERALMVDTTMTHEQIMPIARKLTSLPIDLALTHPHLDHMLQAYAFENVYIHENSTKKMGVELERMRNMLAGAGGGMIIRTPMTPSFIEDAMQLQNVIGIKDGSIIDLGDFSVEAKDISGHTGSDLVFVDHGNRYVYTGDAVGSGYVVGVNYKKGKFAETYTAYREKLDAFIRYIEPLGEYTYFGGHYIQENSCEDPWQEDYLNGQSGYYVPLTLEVIKDMKVLCDKLLSGDYDNEIDPETSNFYVHNNDASLAATCFSK